MNLSDKNYAQYALVQEMMGTVPTVEKFNPDCTKEIAEAVKKAGHLFFTGEGSSRLFPSKNAIRKALTLGMDLNIHTEGARQAAQYDLSKFAVCLASNSGRTKETLLLARKLKEEGNEMRFGLTANPDTPLEEACNATHILQCGWENAVAATKSVVEQALWAESILWNMRGEDMRPFLSQLPGQLATALTLPVPAEVIEWAKNANTIYFAGYNDGVAEELTLKTNEITRRKSDYLEGTYAVHGIEEVMESCDVVFVVDPIEEEIQKFQDVLIGNANLHVVAIADRETPFTTIKVPSVGPLQPYVYLCAGWNVLVEIGMAEGINLDKPTRARKVGNEIGS